MEQAQCLTLTDVFTASAGKVKQSVTFGQVQPM